MRAARAARAARAEATDGVKLEFHQGTLVYLFPCPIRTIRLDLAKDNGGVRFFKIKFLRPAHLGGDTLAKFRPGNSFNKRPPEEDFAAWKGGDA